MQDGDGTANQKQFLTDKQTEYWIINYDAQDFCKEKLEEYGDKSILARVNLSPHAFLYPSAQMGQEIKENVLACVYTTKRGKGD